MRDRLPLIHAKMSSQGLWHGINVNLKLILSKVPNHSLPLASLLFLPFAGDLQVARNWVAGRLVTCTSSTALYNEYEIRKPFARDKVRCYGIPWPHRY